MKLDEIILQPDRDEHHDQYRHHFTNASTIAAINDFVLKRNKDGDDLYYGLFRESDEHLVAYFHLIKSGGYHIISFISVVNEYRGHGYMTYLFDYAINNDNLKIMSDARQTFLAKDMWIAFVRNHRFKIYWYNIKTNEKKLVKYTGNDLMPSPWIDSDDRGWKNAEDVRLIAEEEKLTIDEERILKEQDLRRRKNRTIVEYGSGTSSHNFWNP